MLQRAWFMASPTVSVTGTLLLMTVSLGTLSGASLSRCLEGQFFSIRAQSCLACALCPKNQIIRVPCSHHSDTICGPFFEFFEFHQAPRPTLGVDGSDFVEDEGNRRPFDLDPSHPARDSISGPAQEDGQSGQKHPAPGHSGRHSPPRAADAGQDGKDSGDLTSSDSGEGVKAEDGGSPSAEGGQHMPRIQAPGDEGRQWKVLALALIIVLSVICIVLILFIFIVCYFRAQRSHGKTAFWSPANDPGSELHRPGAPRYFPLPFWAAHVQTPTSGPGERSLTAGSTTSSDGQTTRADNLPLHGTASWEYVYFKSPHNGNGAGTVDV